jgi:hypothetical protein
MAAAVILSLGAMLTKGIPVNFIEKRRQEPDCPFAAY